MITTGSKWFYGLGIVALLLAFFYGWTTGGNGLGPLSGGYKGAVGDHLGYTILVAIAVVAVFLGFVTTAARDADPEVLAQLAGTDSVPPVIPAGASAWPPVAAFGAAVVVLGLVVETFLFLVGGGILLIAFIEWTVRSWSDRATGDPVANREIRNRIMYPLEIPVAGALAIAIVVLSISRVLLATSKLGAVWVAIAVATLVLIAGAVAAARPRASSDLIAALLALAAVGVIGAGIVGAAAGERDFERHGTHAEEGGAEPEGGGAGTGGEGVTTTVAGHG